MPILNRLGLGPKTPVVVTPPEVVTDHEFFFVRGHPRSGTNWVGALLNLHPRINCFGEFHFEDIRNAIDGLQKIPWQITAREPLRTVLDECFEDLVRRSILTLKGRKPTAHWIGDRTPRGLRVFLQHAPYILIIRDGRDVLVSWTYHILRQRPHAIDVLVPADIRPGFQRLYDRFQADNGHFTRHPEELLSDEGWIRMVVKRWGDWMRIDMEAADKIRAEEPGYGGRLLTIRYEELHADTPRGRAEMYEFLGLDPDEAAPISGETKTTAGFEKEDPMSFWRHGQVGDWKRYSNDRFKQWFKESAGEELVRLGYEKDNSW
jgi:Sulfotransferase domain